MKAKRNSFLFRREYAEAINKLPDGMAGRIIRAILEFMFEGIEPKLEGKELSVWIPIRNCLIQDSKDLD